MGFIPQVKCGRCDRTYSGLRSRCPYCGAHRHKKGKRISDGDNATWKLIIGILLIVVLIAAVVVILVTGSPDKDKDKDDTGKTPPNGSNEGVNNQDGNNPDGNNPDGNKTAISVTGADGSAVKELTVKVGEAAELTAAVTPDTVTDKPVWTSSDDAVVKVEAADDTGLKYRVSGVAAGSATVTVTVGDTKYEIKVTCGESGSTGPDSPVLATKITVASQYTKSKPVVDMMLRVGQKVTCTATVTPSNATGVPTWTSSDTSKLEIVPLDETGIKVRLTCVGSGGTVTVTATIDGVSYSFPVYCRKAQ